MIIIDLVKTVYRDLKKKKIMVDKLSTDSEIRRLQIKKRLLQEAYDSL